MDHDLEPPTVNSLLIAERVYQDSQTGQWVIAGVFNRITVERLPTTHARFDVFFQITNVRKTVDLRLRVEHGDGTVVVDIGGPMAAANPLQVVEQRVVLQQVPFSRAGKYWVQLLSHEEILTQAPLDVTVMQEEPDAEPSNPDIE